LADMVSFGIAPGLILFQLIHISLYECSFSKADTILTNLSPVILSFLVPIFSAIRLAKFNIDTRQSISFIGLPTPIAAIFIASLPLISEDYYFDLSSEFLIGTPIVLSALFVMKLPFFSFKLMKGAQLKTKENIIRVLFLIISIILLFILRYDSIPIIVILYLILSILNNTLKL